MRFPFKLALFSRHSLEGHRESKAATRVNQAFFREFRRIFFNNSYFFREKCDLEVCELRSRVILRSSARAATDHQSAGLMPHFPPLFRQFSLHADPLPMAHPVALLPLPSALKQKLQSFLCRQNVFSSRWIMPDFLHPRTFLDTLYPSAQSRRNLRISG